MSSALTHPASLSAVLPCTAPTMSSREIAELVESRHDNVKRTIERLAERNLIRFTPAEETSHEGAGARGVEVYLVGKRDSYVIVAQLSPEFTVRLVDRWQELETAAAASLVPQSFADALQLAADQQRTIEAQHAQIAHLAPKAAALEQIAEIDSTFALKHAAKLIGLKPMSIFPMLERKRWIYRAGHAGPWRGYQEKIEAGLLVQKIRPVDEHAFEQVRITAKGLAQLAADLKVLPVAREIDQREGLRS